MPGQLRYSQSRHPPQVWHDGRRMSGRRYRVGAVHALMDSIDPTRAAFDQWPAADVAHLLDGSLYLDRSRGTADSTELAGRIKRLIGYSAATGAEAILFTGSFFGAAVRQARDHVDVPVLTSFDGLVERGLSLDRPLHVISTAVESARLLVAELEQEVARGSRRLALSSQVVTGAMDALLGGDADRHDRLVIDAVSTTDPSTVILLAQFSMERVLDRCAAARAELVIGPAAEGAARLRRVVASAGDTS